MIQNATVQSDRDEILRIHELWNQVNRTWKMDGFEQYLTDDYVCFAGQGDVVRGVEAVTLEFETLGMWAKGVWEMEIFDRVVEVHGDGGWVHYEFSLRGSFDNEDFNERGRGTEIYRRGDRGWQMAVGHFSMRRR